MVSMHSVSIHSVSIHSVSIHSVSTHSVTIQNVAIQNVAIHDMLISNSVHLMYNQFDSRQSCFHPFVASRLLLIRQPYFHS
jgi:hypothetical protein